MAFFRRNRAGFGDFWDDVAQGAANPTPAAPPQPSGVQQAAALLATIAPHQMAPYPYPYPYQRPSMGIGTGTVIALGGAAVLAYLLFSRRSSP
jgi:hypothetical protein